MAVVNHKQKWIFLAEPHTASRATREALLANCGGSPVGHHHIDLKELAGPREHMDPRRIGEYKVIVGVRNPFDMMVTKYLYAGKGSMVKARASRLAAHMGISREEAAKMPFSEVQVMHEWIASNNPHPTLNDPSKGMDADGTHFIYYENLAEDLETTFGRPVLKPRDPKHTTSNKKHWSHYYANQPATLMYLQDRWAGYMGKYGYSLDQSILDGLSVSICPEVRRLRVKPL
jgi:hypothetical protein